MWNGGAVNKLKVQRIIHKKINDQRAGSAIEELCLEGIQ